MTAPLELAFEVACVPDRAFAVWTGRFSTWWPADHTVTGDPASVVLEPRLGGRIYERARDGTVHEWGEVTAWEPPRRLAYLWHLRTDPDSATDVEIRFVPDAAGTRVEIEHAGWERLGDAADAWRQRNLGGWTTLVPHFVAAVTTP